MSDTHATRHTAFSTACYRAVTGPACMSDEIVCFVGLHDTLCMREPAVRPPLQPRSCAHHMCWLCVIQQTLLTLSRPHPTLFLPAESLRQLARRGTCSRVRRRRGQPRQQREAASSKSAAPVVAAVVAAASSRSRIDMQQVLGCCWRLSDIIGVSNTATTGLQCPVHSTAHRHRCRVVCWQVVAINRESGNSQIRKLSESGLTGGLRIVPGVG